jgi:inner membrane protein
MLAAMPTILTHPAVALGLAPWFRRALPGKRWFAAGALLTVLPDLDTIGFRFGIHYGDLLGHRGLSHSIAFAAVAALALAAFARERRGAVFAYLFLCAVSHGLLDACTDGGLGVAFFAPFDDTRYFFPWRPITVSPIGLHRFLDGSAANVLLSELQWVVLPSALIGLIGVLAARRASRAAQRE